MHEANFAKLDQRTTEAEDFRVRGRGNPVKAAKIAGEVISQFPSGRFSLIPEYGQIILMKAARVAVVSQTSMANRSLFAWSVAEHLEPAHNDYKHLREP